MKRLPGLSTSTRWVLGTIFVLGAGLAWVATTRCEPGSSGPVAASGAAGMAADEFQDPQAIAQRFANELPKVLKASKVPSPVALVEQAAKAKTYPMATVPDPGEKLSPEAIYARARRSVVVVGALPPRKVQRHVPAVIATGFVIGRNGVIVTNYHVLEAFQHSRGMGVMTHEGRVLPIKAVLAADTHKDIVVIQVEADDLVPLPIAASVPVGATVYCLSHPILNSEETEMAFFVFTRGTVSSKLRMGLHGLAPQNLLTITAEYAKGSSGAPVLNEHGALVGIACETRAIYHDEDATEFQLAWKFCRPSSSLLALLQPAAK